MSRCRRWYTVGACALLLTQILPAYAQAKVVATIAPLGFLVAAVMAPETPAVLLDARQSPHHLQLKPSQARLLQQADVVFYIGEGFESFAGRLGTLTSHSVGLQMATPGLTLLPQRSSALWDDEQPDRHADEHADDHKGHDHDDEHHKDEHKAHDHHADEHRGHDHGDGDDPHIWLSVDNAIALTNKIATTLSALYPMHAARYTHNAALFAQRIRRVDAEIINILAPVRRVPFISFHDAFQYFVARYQLRELGVISLGAIAPSVRHIHRIREAIKRHQLGCIFTEPQLPPKSVAAIIEGSAVRQYTLDPIGADLPLDALSYERLLRAVANTLRQCLQRK